MTLRIAASDTGDEINNVAHARNDLIPAASFAATTYLVDINPGDCAFRPIGSDLGVVAPCRGFTVASLDALRLGISQLLAALSYNKNVQCGLSMTVPACPDSE